MNKNLEKEYKELMAEDAPDLWGRIEAGLEPKKSAAKVSFWRKYRAWGMVAAACLCLAIVLPALFEERLIEERGRHDRSGKSHLESLTGSEPSDKNLSGFGYDSTDNFGPQENYSAEKAGDTNFSGQEPMRGTDEDFDGLFTITAKVIEILEEEDKKVYLVRIAETDYNDLAEGDSVRLYSWYDLDDGLLEGEIYLFDIIALQSNGNEDKYFIYDYRYD